MERRRGVNISCIILTRNAGQYARAMTEALARQSLRPDEVLVFDTASLDDTVGVFAEAGARVHHVDPAEFHHGRTRNLATETAQGDFVVFLTQDAVPASDRTLEMLTEPLLSGSAVGSFGRHLPRADASPLERFARTTNYPPVSRTTAESDVDSAGIRALFFSNSCSAIHKTTLRELGGFPEGTVMNEDMLFAARALRNGHRLAYVAEATVWHSHHHSPLETFKRYFDVGSVFTDATADLTGLRTGREGSAYVRKLLAHLMQEGLYHWIPGALLETFLKGAGFWTGRNYRMLPAFLRPRLSLHERYWQLPKAGG